MDRNKERRGGRSTSICIAIQSDRETVCQQSTFFDISLPSSTAHFLNSRQYTAHELVQLWCQTQVVPISTYMDGVQVTEAPLEDSIYVVYIAFLHQDTAALSLPQS